MKHNFKIFIIFLFIVSAKLFADESNSYERYVGIGNCCLPRMQINLYLNKKFQISPNRFGGGQLFDWMVIHDYTKFVIALENELLDVFEYSDLKLGPSWRDNFLYVKNIKYEMTWNHLFSRHPDGYIAPNIIDLEYAEKKSKIDHLTNKFKSLGQYKTLYILAYPYPKDGISPILTVAPDRSTIIRVRDAIKNIRGNSNFTLLYCTYEKTFDSFENISVRTIPNADNGYTSTEQCERWEMIFEEFPHSLEGITEDQNDGLLFV